MEQKANQRLKEQKERSDQDRLELTQKISQLEQDKKFLNEKLELSIRDGQGAGVNLTKKWEKEKENAERLQEELDAVKADRDKKIFDFQTKLEKERENFNQRKREVEKRA